MNKEDIDYILNLLRKGTTTWSGRRDCLKKARKKVWEGEYFKNGKKKYKYHWQCATCKEWFKDEKELEVDHIIEVGPFTGNLHEFCERLYCGQDNLQAICITCHMKKTVNYNATLRHERKEREYEEDIILD